MWDDDPASIAWRDSQAVVDADIEGLARDPGAEALIKEMDAAGTSFEEQRTRLIAYFRGEVKLPSAAE
jgi:hypothetical protein